MDKKFIGIKVVGIKNWLWFLQENISETETVFKGKGGWGMNRGFIEEFSIPVSMIQGRMIAANMQCEANHPDH